MKYQAYPEYKSTGIEWLGEAPEHWHCFRLKHTVYDCIAGYWGDEPGGENDIPVIRVADFDRVKFRVNFPIPTYRYVEPKALENRLLKKGDLLLEKSGGGDNQLVGAVVLLDKDVNAITANFINKMTPNKYFNSNYLVYVFAFLYGNRVNYRHINQTTGIQNINSNSYLCEKVYFPEINEQSVIAIFLDTETTRIDKLIKEKEHFIELLEEKRQALITHAVTNGLDSNTTMKSSGNEWLSDVPEHWTVKRLKFVIQLNPSKSEVRHLLEDGIDVSFLPMELVNEDGTYHLTENRNINDVYSGFTYCMNDDVILAKITPCFENGKGALLKGLTNSIAFGSTEFHVLRPVSSVGKFVWYLTKTNLFGEIGKTEMKGAVGQQRIPSEFVENFYFAQPSLDEQQDIVDYLDIEAQKIDDIIKETRHSIDLLKEHRIALISAAVTGKIDVRHLAKEAA